MKKQILFLLISFIFLSCNDKKDSNATEKQTESLILPPPPPKIVDENSLIGFACYSSGRKSEPVKTISKLLVDKNYNGISKKLSSKSVAEKYLATVVCKKLEKRNLISLTRVDQSQIEENLISDEKIVICSGCTNKKELAMKELFSSDTFLSVYLEEWLKKMIK